MKKGYLFIFGIITGFINLLLGAGGGMLAVPVLKADGIEQKQAQATAIAVTLPLSVISLIIYLSRGIVKPQSSIFVVLLGSCGAFLGAYLLKKISNKWLRRIFAVFLLWASVRMLMK